MSSFNVIIRLKEISVWRVSIDESLIGFEGRAPAAVLGGNHTTLFLLRINITEDRKRFITQSKHMIF